MNCVYLNRFQLHDIEEFMSAYFVTNSNDEFYLGKVIIGHEQWNEDTDSIQEQFYLAPDSIYEGHCWVLISSDIEQIVWDYFKKEYTEKTGQTDYDSLCLESDEDCWGELIPAYDEDQYTNRSFAERAVAKAKISKKT